MAIQDTAKLAQGARRTAAGFTLIEMVIVVVIVGFLMMLALPAYQESVRKGRRADAKAGLMTAANRQESLMLDRHTYTADVTELGFEDIAGMAGSQMRTEEGHYSVAAAACADATIATCYVLTATPVAGDPQEDDLRCASFILDSTGAKTATGTAVTECW